MGFVINTNVMSINAQRNLRKTQAPLESAMQRLSSGLRINSAKDDAAGLAIATRMTSQIRGLNVAVRNANDGLSVVQTAEGAMDEIINNIQRVRELAVQARSGQYSASDISFMQAEVNALVTEISRISTQTRFNDISILDATGGYNQTIHISYKASDTGISVNISNMDIDQLGSGSNYLNTLQTGQTYALSTVAATMQTTMNILDGALNTLLNEKANLGALANRFQAAIRNLDNIVETTEAARSRISDADFAVETANLTKQLILQQAGVSVLAQANTLPQNVLALLQ